MSLSNRSRKNSVASGESALFDATKQDIFRAKVQKRKEKNEANLNLANFKTLIAKRDAGNKVSMTQEKLALLPISLESDPNEALLYLYFCVRYFDEHLFKVILSRTNHIEGGDPEIEKMMKDPRIFNRLTDEKSFDRYSLNQIAFETALDKDYMDIAFHFIENNLVSINWEMVRKMLANR
jgi:hypothetical protein